MNIENIKKTIAIMERAKATDSIRMQSWQSTSFADCANTESELHLCGNKACLAGYVAISPEWKVGGGVMHATGEPYIPTMPEEKWDAAPALARWWGVADHVGELLVHPYSEDGLGTGGLHSVYGKPWMDVRVDDVIKALNELIEIGSEEFLNKYWPPSLPDY